MSTIRNILKKLILFSVIMTCVFCFFSCKNTEEETPDAIPREKPLTAKEIRSYTIKNYFNKDGTAQKDKWILSYQLLDEYTGYYHYEFEEITDYDIQIINDPLGNPTFYLVEFEPTGFLCGNLWYDLKYHSFCYRESPYKILNIEKDNRYFDSKFFCNDYPFFATKMDGKIVDITNIAWTGKYEYGLGENIYSVYVYDPPAADVLRSDWISTYYEKKGDTYVEYKKDWE